MDSNLRKVFLLIQNEPLIGKHFVFDFSDALFIAELAYGDHFFMYYSKSSDSFLVFHYARNYINGPDDNYSEENKSTYSAHRQFAEALDEINKVLTENGTYPFAVHTKNWYTSLPAWLNLQQKFVCADFKELFMAEMISTEGNLDQYSKEERKQLQGLKLNLVERDCF